MPIIVESQVRISAALLLAAGKQTHRITSNDHRCCFVNATTPLQTQTTRHSRARARKDLVVDVVSVVVRLYGRLLNEEVKKIMVRGIGSIDGEKAS